MSLTRRRLDLKVQRTVEPLPPVMKLTELKPMSGLTRTLEQM